MMKKMYQQPQMNVVKVQAYKLLAGSGGLPNSIPSPTISSSYSSRIWLEDDDYYFDDED